MTRIEPRPWRTSHSPQVQAVVGDREPVALRRPQQILSGDAQAVELEPIVMQALDAKRP